MGSSGGTPPFLFGNLVATGEETVPRDFLTTTSAATPASQQVRLTYFTARKSATTTQVKLYTGATAAAATPTLCRVGLYTVAASDNSLTLVASIANDTSLFASTTTAYTRSWSVPYVTVAGQRYALGVLVVSATTMPTFSGAPPTAIIAEATGVNPILSAVVTGQSDLPSSIVAGSLVNSGMRTYAVLS